MKNQLNHLLIALTLTFLSLLVPSAGAQSVTLGITNDATLGVSVYWPLADADWSLQWTPALSPTTWQPYPDVPSLSEDGNYLIVNVAAFELTNPYAFFQLVSNTVIVPAAPSVVTLAAAPVNTTTAGLNGSVQPNTFDTTYYFQWGADTSYGQTTSSGVVAGSNTAPVSVQLGVTGLTPGTTYHFQLFGSNILGIASGGDLTFTTATPLPDAIVLTYGASNVTSTSAILVGAVNGEGTPYATFFQWGATASYGNQTPHVFTSVGNFNTDTQTFLLTNLSASTTYHYRIAAFNGGPDEALGNDVTFTTSASVQQPPPIVTSLAASSITASSAILNGNANPNGAEAHSYFEYGTTTGYGTVTALSDLGGGSTVQSLQYGVGSLLPNTTYHYRIVAYNSGGASDGADVTFTTGSAPQAPPTVISLAASSVTASSAILNGSANPNGAEAHSYFEYGATTAYGSVTALSDLGGGSTVQSLQYAIGSLLPNTTYHYRIVAYNSGGTSDGADVTFTTGSSQAPPAVQTLAASQITTSAAALNGSVNPNGVDSHTYFQWGTTISYGNTAGFGDVGSGNSAQSDVYGLSSGTLAPRTTYHYRLVGYNSAGTNYGGDVSFSTLPPPPSVTTEAPSGVTGHGDAVLNASANPNGGNTCVYFQYGTTTSYGSTTSWVGIGSSTSPQQVGTTITGLASSTYYHYRAVATSPGGTVYGSDVLFNSSGTQ